jgi:autotransporter strand-loop-strand O-heptosyltransferase
MKEVLIKEYNNIQQLNIPPKEGINAINFHFIDGAFIEITGPEDKKYNIKCINKITNEVVHNTTISNNMWTKTNAKYFINWKIEVRDGDDLIFTHDYDAKGRRVYIHLDSGAIGDTLAWFPYLEEFRKKHDCKLICSTFHNEWFESQYPEIEFAKPGTSVEGLYAMYNIGWFYNEDHTVNKNRIPIDFKQYPLGQTSTEILGLKYNEIKPKLTIPNKSRQIDGKYVVIAPHASAHAKYWNNPGGWQAVINYLNDKGYKVVMITSEKLGDEWHDSKLGGTLKNVIDKTGNYPLEDRMVDLKYADLYIGLGSGLSWLSWSIGIPTILISGFSQPYSEFLDCERIFNYDTDICTGCFNTHRLDAGDWEWCPEHKNTDRMFECTKTITSFKVISAIDKLLNIYNKN